MSNPSGPDQDGTPAAEETQAPAEPSTEAMDTREPVPQFESAEPTEVLPGSGEHAEPERRYSAPSGFDVRSTEIIHTSPEPPTEVIGARPTPSEQAAAGAVTTPARSAPPQAIPPRSPRHRSWGLVVALILVIAALAAIAVLGTVWLTHRASPKASQEDQVQQTIQDFDTAIQKGDLAQLRGITCGSTRDDYVKYRDQDWAATYPRIASAKQYPVVASIDQVVVNDQHAEANVTSFMAYAPQVRSTRSFDLQYLDGRWKICEGPIS